MSESDLPAGTVIVNRYVVGAELGAGAMGSVHLAEQTALDRMVAIKVLRTDGPVTARARRRLHREARAVARISHPNVVQVHDYGETYELRPFLVMERIEGPTARAWYRQDPTLEDVLDATDAALAGLAAAHAAGVLHRDLKPANMLVRAGDPKQLVLVDFGIAAVLREPQDDDDEDDEPPISATLNEGASRLTRPGTVMGTPLYMSPEQAMGVDAGPASDVYAMGIILYEWLHGRPPFSGPVRDVMYAHVHRTLPEGDARYDLPPGLRELLRRALEKDDARRFPDAAAMRRALQRVRRSGGEVGSPRAVRGRAESPPTLLGKLSPDAIPSVPAKLPFAAREAEFLNLVALLQPRDGRGRIVLVRGASGLGKTRLVREAVEAVARTGAARVGAGVAREEAGPFAEIVSALAELDGNNSDITGAREQSMLRGGYDDGLERRVRSVAGGLPAILLLDDLHRAGPATFSFLERIAEAQLLDPFALTVVATLEAGISLSRLSRHAEVVDLIDLPRMTDAGIEELMTSALALTDEAARRLAAPCGGSPLLAAQLLRHVVRSNLLEPSDGGWELPDDALGELGGSPSVEQLLRFRLDGLLANGAAVVAVMEAAAVLGDRFDVDQLEDVLAVGDAPLGGESLDDVLDQLLSEGALAEILGPGDRLAWDSGLLRQLVLADMQGSRRRRRLSAAAARALSDVPGSERAVVELFLLAGEPFEAAPFAVDAGEDAVLAGEWNDAVRFLSTGLASGSLGRRPRLRALFAMAEADNALGRRQEAEARFEEALRHAETSVESARAWFGVGRSRHNRGETKEAVDGLTTALEVLDGDAGRPASRLRNRIVRTLAATAQNRSRRVKPDAPAESDGPLERLEYFKTVGTLALLQDEPVAAAEAYRSALTEARAAGAEADEPRVLHDLGVALRRAGQADDAKRILLEALEAARRVRTRPLEAKLLNELGELSRALGAPKAARDHYAGAVAIWEARGDHQAFVGRLNLALTDVESDRSARAVRSLEGLAARPEGIPDRWRVPYALTSAFAFASSGNHDSAEAELDVAVYLLLGARANPPEARAMIALIQALWQAENDVTRADRAALMLTQLSADK